MSSATDSKVDPLAASPLWHEPAPRQFDLALPWWVKALIVIVLTGLAIVFVDARVAVWAKENPTPDLMRRLAPGERGPGDIGRELMFMEQFGQFSCTVGAIAVVFFLDPAGRRRALALALTCLFTVLLTHLLKDLFGRSRPFVAPTSGDGSWIWGGPVRGFKGGSSWGSFPSAHTTAAFALASGLSWFYPRGRLVFMYLATFTATLRVLHHAHYVSDVIAGMGIGVFVARCTLHYSVAGHLIRRLPAFSQRWWLHTYTDPLRPK